MKQRLRLLTIVIIFSLLERGLHGATVSLPLELQQHTIPWNLQTIVGVALSSSIGAPVGSDGRAPTPAQQSGDGLTTTQPNAKQFQGLVSFGGVGGRTFLESATASQSAELNSGTTPLSGGLAQQIKLPVGLSNNAVVLVMRRSIVGAPYLSKQVSFMFGSVIEVPSNDEDDKPLPTATRKEDYWLAEPHSLDRHSGAGYYWSPHARKAFAIQAGPISVVWKKASGTANVPADFAINPSLYSVESGVYYRLYTARYVVSGGSVKPPKKMFWTQGSFASTGKPVNVPGGRVGRINIVYNSNFPEKASEEYTDLGQSRITSATNTLQELRTFWYDPDQKHLFAYNREGRVFMELLGDLRPDGATRLPLGFEVVDILKQPTPEDVTIELGDLVLPPDSLLSKGPLAPEPLSLLSPRSFAKRHNVVGSDLVNYYAITETINQNDYLVFWLESGVAGLKWPAGMGRYQFIWPPNLLLIRIWFRSDLF